MIVEREGANVPKTTTRDRAAWLEREWVFQVAFATLAIAYLLPLWLAHDLPMQDLPNHLALVDILAHRHDEPGWSQHFLSRLSLRPYVTYYALALALAKPLGVRLANGILIGGYVLALPASLFALLRASGARNPWPALLGFPLAYNDCFLVGFTNFLLGIPLALAALALALADVREPAPTLVRPASLCALCIAMYLTHPFVLALWSLAALACGLGSIRTVRGWSRFAPAQLLSALLLALAAMESESPGGPALRLGLWTKSEYVVGYPALFTDAVGRGWGVAAAGAGIAMLLFVRVRGAKRSVIGWGLFAMALAVVLLPFGRGAVLWLDARAVLFAWLLAIAWSADRVAVDARGRVALLGFCAVVCGAVIAGHLAFNREAAPLRALLQRLPVGERVLPIAIDRQSDAVKPFYLRTGVARFVGLYTHFGGYYRLERGGTNPFLTFHPSLGWMPVELRDPGFDVFDLDAPLRPDKLLARLPVEACSFDALLVRGADAEAEARLGAIALRADREGVFSWWRVRGCAAR